MKPAIAKATPSAPPIPGPIERRVWGIIHRALFNFSIHYCRWFNIPFGAGVAQLPFGLILKWTMNSGIEELVAMQLARAAGMPVPKVLCFGEHPTPPGYRPFSILMTRLPGMSLENSGRNLDVDAEGPWLHELKTCVHSMRQWEPLQQIICSPIGTPIRTARVPAGIMGPFENKAELHSYLLESTALEDFHSRKKLTGILREKEYEETLLRAKNLEQRPHRITFTHGDFKADNILVDDYGHLSGFLDWESAGWCPEYWDYITAMRFGRNSWWYQVVMWMGGDQYREELDSDVALNEVTFYSYSQ